MNEPQPRQWAIRVPRDERIACTNKGFGAYFYVGRTLVRLLWILQILFATEQVSAAMRKAPYVLYAGTNTEMEVHWQLTTTAPCTVEWGLDTSYALGTEQTIEYGSGHQHRYTVPDLTLGSKYYYRVTSGTETFTGSFRAAIADSTSNLKFLAYGDTRSNPGTHDAVANAMVSTFVTDSDYQSLVISVGDLVTDGNTESYWDSEFFNPSYTHIRSLLV
jgi:phosphodiesterase/alkaline phosphatase D-like protein